MLARVARVGASDAGLSIAFYRQVQQGPLGKPAFYSYTAPAPEGLSDAKVRPGQAFYSKDLGEYLLMYDDVRNAADPDAALMEFLQSTYGAGANLAKWDRPSLER